MGKRKTTLREKAAQHLVSGGLPRQTVSKDKPTGGLLGPTTRIAAILEQQEHNEQGGSPSTTKQKIRTELKSLKKGERLMAKKKLFRQTIASINKKNPENKITGINDLQSLQDLLSNDSMNSLFSQSRDSKNTKNTNMSKKDRQKLIENETKHFQQVLSHPEYKKDPLGALTVHLTNSVAMQKDHQKKTQKLEKRLGVSSHDDTKKKKKKKKKALPKLEDYNSDDMN